MRKKKVNESKKRDKGEMLFVNYFDQIKLAIRKIYCNYNNIRMSDYS